MSTLSTLVTMVRGFTGRADKDLVAAAGLRLALDEVVRRLDLPDQRTSVDITVTALTTAGVPLPVDCKRVVSVRVTDGTSTWPVDYRAKASVLRFYPNSELESLSTPTQCYTEGSTLYLAPMSTVGLTLKLTYIKKPSFSSVTDPVNSLPDAETAMVFWASSYVFEACELGLRADRMLQRYGQALSDLVLDKAKTFVSQGSVSVSDPLDDPNAYLDPFVGH
jgi:hypothetical protein